jgi:hypothetical protein
MLDKPIRLNGVCFERKVLVGRPNLGKPNHNHHNNYDQGCTYTYTSLRVFGKPRSFYFSVHPHNGLLSLVRCPCRSR